MIRPKEKNCCGCRACEMVCPQNCISMNYNGNGFLMPHVDVDACVNCGMCEKVCPVKEPLIGRMSQRVLAAYGKPTECNKSTSGGIFYCLAKQAIKNGEVVFGASFGAQLYCEHKAVDEEGELESLQGSKYVQSDTKDSYLSVQKYLNDGRKVLFSGTPCQIAGLKKTLETTRCSIDNLLTVEIVCHGVPSPQMYADYIRWLEMNQSSRVLEYKFRTKKAKGRDFRCVVRYSDGHEEIISGFKDPFYKMYMQGISMREVCYECPYARKERIADITLGDFWNIEDVDIKFGNGKRVSIVTLNTDRGMKAWDSIISDIVYRETNWNIAVKGNGNLQAAPQKPFNYVAYGSIVNKDAFFEDVFQLSGDRKKEFFNSLSPMIRRVMKKLVNIGKNNLN